jgi:predicted transcriptional regulator
MATGESQIPSLPEGLLAAIEKIAREQNRSVGEVLTEAVNRYIQEQQWQALKGYGQARAQERGLSDTEVPRLVAEYRSERSRVTVMVPR